MSIAESDDKSFYNRITDDRTVGSLSQEGCQPLVKALSKHFKLVFIDSDNIEATRSHLVSYLHRSLYRQQIHKDYIALGLSTVDYQSVDESAISACYIDCFKAVECLQHTDRLDDLLSELCMTRDDLHRLSCALI